MKHELTFCFAMTAKRRFNTDPARSEGCCFLRDSGRSRSAWLLLACAWDLIACEGRTPPSWTLADRLIERDVGGIIVPSFGPGTGAHGQNIVFWQWQTEPPHQVAVIDDDNSRLGSDRLSREGKSSSACVQIRER